MWLVVYEYVIKLVMCVSVQHAKMCWFVKKLQQRACSIKRSSKFVVFHPYFDPQATLYVWIQNLWGSKKKLPCQGNLTHTSLRGFMTWKVMPRNVWSDVADWRTKGPSNCTKLQLHALMTIHSKKKNWDLEELSKVCSQIVLKCLYLARIGRPDILWSVNKLARSSTKLTRTCDKRLVCLISYIHHTCEFKQYCMHNSAGWECFRTLTLPEMLKTQNRLQEEVCAYLEVTGFVPMSWMCRKQTSV